jgi:hypothetical protein
MVNRKHWWVNCAQEADAGEMTRAKQTAPAKLDATVKAIFSALHVLFDADAWPWDQVCSATHCCNDCRGWVEA